MGIDTAESPCYNVRMITSAYKILSAPSRNVLTLEVQHPNPVFTSTRRVDVPLSTYYLLEQARVACEGGMILEITYPLDGKNAAQWPCKHDTRTINATDLYFTRSGNWIIRGTRTDTGEARSYRCDVIACVRRIEATTGNVVDGWGFEPTTGNYACSAQQHRDGR